MIIHDNSDSIDNNLHEQLNFKYPKKEDAKEQRHAGTLMSLGLGYFGLQRGLAWD
jgi:hypothetical protein